jgi:hypothetical protein
LTKYFWGQKTLFTKAPFWAIFGENWRFFRQTFGHTEQTNRQKRRTIKAAAAAAAGHDLLTLSFKLCATHI